MRFWKKKGQDQAKDKKPKHSVVFYCYPKLLFCWPLIVFGPLFWILGAPSEDPASGRLEVLGWLYLLTMFMVVLTIGIDLERNYSVFWVVAFLLFFFLGRWLVDAKGFTFFGDIYGWFANLDVQYDRGFALVLSIVLAGPFAMMLLWSRLQHKWRITHNEFEHYSWGRTDDSLARGAKRVRSTYPDVLELLLGFGAGTLIVYSATGRSELRRIHNVPFLPLVRRRINWLLEQTAVTTDADAAAIDGELTDEQEESDANQTLELAGDDDDGGVGNEPL